MGILIFGFASDFDTDSDSDSDPETKIWSGFKTSDRAEDQGAGRRKSGAYTV